ncbi:MAG: exo-beta-N-acetylmuramidase NamZ family protein [Flavobacteriaceae bacterium]
MLLNSIKNTALLFVMIVLSCGNSSPYQNKAPLTVAANQLELYLPLLKNKRVGIVANQTSVIFKNGSGLGLNGGLIKNDNTHLVDSLIKRDVSVVKVFAPEHGYRGRADAGEYVKGGVDLKTGLPIVSLYGENRKPNPNVLEDLDVVVFDIQDVGTRFYTFVSTLHYMMEGCAALDIPLIVLDRPNPNGHYVDGPVLDLNYKSFVGMHAVPITHGMTLGEFAKMINGEHWLEDDLNCDLTVIPVANYNRKDAYMLPIPPSPNLPNQKAINLYPSLCLFEGTQVSVGRGTENQFQIFGSPFLGDENYSFQFIPKPNFGAKNPKHNAKTCYGKDLKNVDFLNEINLNWLIEAYENTTDKSSFFNSFFTKLAGQTILQQQIEKGWSALEIKKSWQKDLEQFKILRANYLLYP